MDVDIIGLSSVLLLFGLIPAVVGIVLVKIRTRQMETLVKLVEHGAQLDAETIRLMSGRSADYRTDYRWGMFWLALGIPTVAGIWNTVGIGMAVWGLIPVLIGVALLVAGKMRLRGAGDGATDRAG